MKNIGLIIFISISLLSCDHKSALIECNFTENTILKLTNEYNIIYTNILNNNRHSFVEYFETEEIFYKYLIDTIANNKFDKKTFLINYNTLIDNIPNEFNKIAELENIEYKYLIDYNIIAMLFVFEAIYLGEIRDTPMNEIIDNVNIKNLNGMKKIFVAKDMDIIKKYKKYIIETVFKASQ